MRVKISFIFKLLKNNNVLVLSDGSDDKLLPSFYLNDSTDITTQIAKYLRQTYNIGYSWLDIKYVDSLIHNKELIMFYTSFFPEDFLNEKDINKNVLSIIDSSTEIIQVIHKGLRIYPSQ